MELNKIWNFDYFLSYAKNILKRVMRPLKFIQFINLDKNELVIDKTSTLRIRKSWGVYSQIFITVWIAGIYLKSVFPKLLLLCVWIYFRVR